MAMEVNSDLKGWFMRHTLPWGGSISKALLDEGVENVEELKLLPPELFLGLFKDEKYVTKQKAKLAYDELKKEEFSFEKCASAKLTKKPRKGKRAIKYPNMSFEGHANEMKAAKERSELFQKGAETPAANKEKFEPIDWVTNLWAKEGQQDNTVRNYVLDCFDCKMGKATIARRIREVVFSTAENPWDGVANGDDCYAKIYATLYRCEKDKEQIRKAKEDGAMRSKSIKANARGRKHLDKKAKLEGDLYA